MKRVHYCLLEATVICKIFGVQLTWTSRAREAAAIVVTVRRAVIILNGYRWREPRTRLVCHDSLTIERRKCHHIMPIADHRWWRCYLMSRLLVPLRFIYKLPRPSSANADVDTVLKGTKIIKSLLYSWWLDEMQDPQFVWKGFLMICYNWWKSKDSIH